MITLILGGVRSGKSRYAQALAEKSAKVIFLATAEAGDDEMRARIEHHQQERPATWRTVEVPVDLDTALIQHGNNGALLLVDCLTLFTANLLAAEKDNANQIQTRVDRLCAALKEVSAASIVLVSNEVGSGIVPAYASGRQFRDLLGEINQRVAQIADNVVLMVAGCPMAVKGTAEVLR